MMRGISESPSHRTDCSLLPDRRGHARKLRRRGTNHSRSNATGPFGLVLKIPRTHCSVRPLLPDSVAMRRPLKSTSQETHWPADSEEGTEIPSDKTLKDTLIIIFPRHRSLFWSERDCHEASSNHIASMAVSKRGGDARHLARPRPRE